MENKQWTMMILILLVATELVLTGFLSYKAATSVAGFCVIGNDVGNCESVQNSEYGKIFGIKLGYIGLFSFLVLSVALARDFRRKKLSRLFVVLTLIGFLFALYLIYLQIFVLKQICTACIVVDGIAIAIFFVSMTAFRKAPLV